MTLHSRSCKFDPIKPIGVQTALEWSHFFTSGDNGPRKNFSASCGKHPFVLLVERVQVTPKSIESREEGEKKTDFTEPPHLSLHPSRLSAGGGAESH